MWAKRLQQVPSPQAPQEARYGSANSYARNKSTPSGHCFGDSPMTAIEKAPQNLRPQTSWIDLPSTNDCLGIVAKQIPTKEVLLIGVEAPLNLYLSPKGQCDGIACLDGWIFILANDHSKQHHWLVYTSTVMVTACATSVPCVKSLTRNNTTGLPYYIQICIKGLCQRI